MSTVRSSISSVYLDRCVLRRASVIVMGLRVWLPDCFLSLLHLTPYPHTYRKRYLGEDAGYLFIEQTHCSTVLVRGKCDE